MSLINKEVSAFSVQAFQNKEDLLGKWSVFFFYPADFTFVCPTELEDLQNNYEKFKAINCEIYSVSCDTHFVHKAWHDHSERISKLEYPMLADPTHTLARDADELLRKVEACQFVHEHGDEVCPAKWKPGEKTLKPTLDLVGAL